MQPAIDIAESWSDWLRHHGQNASNVARAPTSLLSEGIADTMATYPFISMLLHGTPNHVIVEDDEGATRMSYTKDRASPQSPLLPEFTVVELTAPIEQGRHRLPAGARGTIMSVFPKTGTYTIEFISPKSCVIPAVAKDMVRPED